MKLTLPSYELGACDIRVDGETVGFCLGNFHDWSAFLWPVADQRRAADDCEEVRAPRLRDLRDLLGRRLNEDGPWWTTTPPAPTGDTP